MAVIEDNVKVNRTSSLAPAMTTEELLRTTIHAAATVSEHAEALERDLAHVSALHARHGSSEAVAAAQDATRTVQRLQRALDATRRLVSGTALALEADPGGLVARPPLGRI